MASASEKLYTDQGKIFTCAHLQVVCANLKIKLIHARPYAAWSKGKIEKFFQTVQRDFQERLRLEPVGDLEALNARFWRWLESEYHRRAHSALGGQYPADRFAQKATALRQLPSDTDWRQVRDWHSAKARFQLASPSVDTLGTRVPELRKPRYPKVPLPAKRYRD